jgi:hypothetical protein
MAGGPGSKVGQGACAAQALVEVQLQDNSNSVTAAEQLLVVCMIKLQDLTGAQQGWLSCFFNSNGSSVT